MADGVSLWAMAGLGSCEIDDAEAGVQARDLMQQMAGATLTPSIELGLRDVGGDGETGTGLVPTGARAARARDFEFRNRSDAAGAGPGSM